MVERSFEEAVSSQQKKQFEQEGYLLIQGLFAAEADRIKAHFMELHSGGPIEGCFSPVSPEQAGADILKQYPRMLHPHKVDAYSKALMLDIRVKKILDGLFDEQPLAAQSMFYFKPPGALGQALHQDQFYTRAEPGTCIAAWMAVDDSNEENGGLMIVPGSNRVEVQCPHQANPERSFTKDEVDVPDGYTTITIQMKSGDVLFFHGNVIHGSYPNRSTNQFRRSFICHYVSETTTKVNGYYKPLLQFDGQEYAVEESRNGGPCGTPFEPISPH